jgi:co-chaperonin GroES (HSP10)
MAINLKTHKGDLRPVGDRVLVRDMYFGEQRTKGGIIINDDDGKTRGIYPRWAKVYAKGPKNIDDYNVGDWVLVTHGRWTRGVKIDNGNEEVEIRMVEAESILATSDDKPSDVYIGKEFSDGPADIRPEDFGAN